MSLDIYFYPPAASTWDHSQNVTHNLSRMADEVGLEKPLWYPEDVGISTAGQLIEPLQVGLAKLVTDPVRYREFNPSNVWGDYDQFVVWLIALLAYCQQNPESRVEVSR